MRCSRSSVEAFMSLARNMGVEATVLGRFTDSGNFHILYDGKTVACLDMEFLHAGPAPHAAEGRVEAAAA